MDLQEYEVISGIYSFGDNSDNQMIQNLQLETILKCINDLTQPATPTGLVNTFRNLLVDISRGVGGILSPNPSRIPYFDDKGITKLKAYCEHRNNPVRVYRETASLAAGIIASLLVEFPERLAGVDYSGDMRLFIETERISYVQWKAMVPFVDGSVEGPASRIEETKIQYETELTKLKDIATQYTDAIQSRQQALSQLQNDTRSASDTVNDLSHNTKAQIEGFVKSINYIEENISEIDKRFSLTEVNYRAFEAAIRARNAFKESGDVWGWRALINTVGFFFSLLILVLMLIAVPWYAINHFAGIEAFISKINQSIKADIGDGTNASLIALASLNRIIVIAAPLLLYLWLVKIVVRYNMHALVMGNDARLRKSILSTYVYLLENKLAAPEDRAKLLDALFRPPPGQTGDGVEAPDLTAIVDKLKPGG